MMPSGSFNKQRKIFGGTNFLVVLWALLTIFRAVVSIKMNASLDYVIESEVIIYMVPLMFMAILNIFLGITLFFPQEKNKMWILSVIVVTVTLATLNLFQNKLDLELQKAKTNHTIIEEF